MIQSITALEDDERKAWEALQEAVKGVDQARTDLLQRRLTGSRFWPCVSKLRIRLGEWEAAMEALRVGRS